MSTVRQAESRLVPLHRDELPAGGKGDVRGAHVGAAEADPRAGKISNESPLGKALINRHPGDIITVDAPGGSFKVKLLKTT